MIAFLTGRVAAKTPMAAYVDVGGVGFEVAMAQDALSRLPSEGEQVTLLTYLQASDSGLSLYGFLKPEEKALFERLIAVSGVGPKMTLAALSTFSPEQLASAIADEDAALVARIPGVGKKTASRIILELKGSIAADGTGLFGQTAEEAVPAPAAPLAAASEALMSMGFTPAEVELALKGAPEGAGEAQLVKHALKRIGGR